MKNLPRKAPDLSRDLDSLNRRKDRLSCRGNANQTLRKDLHKNRSKGVKPSISSPKAERMISRREMRIAMFDASLSKRAHRNPKKKEQEFLFLTKKQPQNDFSKKISDTNEGITYRAVFPAPKGLLTNTPPFLPPPHTELTEESGSSFETSFHKSNKCL